MKLKFSFALLFFTLISFTSLAQKKVLAVAPFEVPEDMKYRYDFSGSGLVQKIPDLLEAELFKLGKFELVERERLDALIDEQTLSYAGMTDKEYDFGALKGVDYFVLGSISGFSTDFDNVQVKVGFRNMYVNNQNVQLSLTVKLVDVTTGKMLAVITEEADVSKKGRPRGNQKHGVDKEYIDEAAKEVSKLVAASINEKVKG